MIDDGQVLLVQRARDPWRGAWDLPGGFCEGNEHPMHAPERELFEEVGLRATAVAYLGTWIDVYGIPARDGAIDHTANSAHIVRTNDELVTLSTQVEEMIEARWFPFSALPPQLAFPDHLTKVLDVAALVNPHLANCPELHDRSWSAEGPSSA